MPKTRQIIAVTLVAAALCADHALAVAPNLRPQVASTAGKLVSRLSVRFSRVVTAVRVYQVRREDSTQITTGNQQIAHLPVILYSQARLSPLLLRLPPPVV